MQHLYWGSNMKEFLASLLQTLNCIEVKGKDNMNYLLGCILAIEQQIKKIENEDSVEKEE